MSKTLRILIVEDSKPDAEMMLRQIRRAGNEIISERVETKAAMQAELSSKNWDAVIADYSLPHFSGEGALETLKESGLDLPFILVSGTVGEETAVKMMKAGANDYILKDKMERLSPAIEREVGEYLSRRDRRKAEEKLQRNQQQVAFLSEASGILGTSFDYEETIRLAVRASIPSFCDFGLVYVLEAKGGFKIIASSHSDPKKAKEIEDRREQYFLEPNVQHGYPKVIRTGASEIIPEVNESILVSLARNPEHLNYLRKLGIKSSLCVPMIARNLTLGSVTLFMMESNRHFNQQDLWVAEEFARRAASAIDNAQLFREAQHAIKVRDEFLIIASHELKTPITSLKLQLQLARRRVMTDNGVVPSRNEIAKTIDVSINQVNRLSKLIEDMMDVTQMQIGKLNLVLAPVDLSVLIRDVLDRYAAELTAAGFTLELEIGKLIIGNWDRSRLEQVIINLISNAIKYAAGTKLRISATEDNGKAIFTVNDSGVGISKDKQATIFERYGRATSDRSIVGLGLGLFICRQIVEAHGGTIRVESEEGKGASFIVELPIERSFNG